MSTKKTLTISAVALVLVGLIVATIIHSKSNITAVTTVKVGRQELVSVVSGTGQIKPKTYVNIGATAFGRITHLNVKEGDTVKQGQVLATIENVQASSAVAAQQATIASNRTDVNSYVAAENTAVANLAQAQADLKQKKYDIERYELLYKNNLVAKQDYDAKVAAFGVSAATVQQREAAVAQAKAQTASAQGHVQQAVASQQANYDSLDKTVSRAPFDGLVTNVPVREGETMVTGIQNALGSTLMTLADMSVITAEVKVDETDIVNVKLDQPVQVTVDAIPGRTFKGHVSEVGDQALLRTTGIATSQSTTGTEEAKDFKVVVTLDETIPALKPGLSATAKITTATLSNTIAIPIQALVQRDPVLEKKYMDKDGKLPLSETSASTGKAASAGTQGVYLMKNIKGTARTVFVPVETGITGATEIAVTSGLTVGDEVVTGRFKVLRTLHAGTRVKRDTSLAADSSE